MRMCPRHEDVSQEAEGWTVSRGLAVALTR